MTPARARRPEREFGLVVGAVLCALGSWWVYRAKFAAAAPAVLSIGAALILLGAFRPGALRYPYRVWMGLAEALAFIATRIILALVFFAVVTPIGILRKALGSDPLRRRARAASSYWWPYSPRQSDPKHYEKMF
ncbi:MAG TPA: SxtJ family membrane protein [Thermoanaerobaculia bacterium]